MKLSKEAVAKMDKVFALYQEMVHEANELTRMVEAETDNKLSVCTVAVPEIQFYQNTDTETAKELISDIADNAVDYSWSKNNNSCYRFTVNHHPCCILVNEMKKSEMN